MQKSRPAEIFKIMLRNISWDTPNATSSSSSTLLTLNTTDSFFPWEV